MNFIFQYLQLAVLLKIFEPELIYFVSKFDHGVLADSHPTFNHLRRLASFETESVNLGRLHLLDSLHLLNLRPE